MYLCISGYRSTNISAVTLSRGSKVVDGTVLAGVHNNNGWFMFDWGGWISGELTVTVEYRTNALAQSNGCYLAAAMAYSINMVQVPWMQVSYGHTSMSNFQSANVGQTVWTQFGAPNPDNPLNSSLTVKLRYGIDGYYGDKLIATFYVPFLSEWDSYDDWALPYLVQDVSALVVDNGVERVHLPVDFRATYMPTRPISVGQGTWSSCFYVECIVDLSDNTLAGYISPSVELRIVSPGFVLDYDSSGHPDSYGCALEIGVAGYSRPLGSVSPDAGFAAVSVLQLVYPRASGLREELVAHADAEDGELLVCHSLADVLHGGVARVGVARSVGDEEAVELQLVEVVVPGHADDLHAAAQEAAQDVGLDAAVN